MRSEIDNIFIVMEHESFSRHSYEVKLTVMFFNSFEWMIKTNALRNLHKSIMSYIVAMVALGKKYQNMLTKHTQFKL